ncbi:MAG: tetratricopeptide repeat protein [Candidatus Krumholzibacteriia bacterium]
MSAVEKTLKKAQQDRSKGHFERALSRLKEAVAQAPREYLVAREAASLCFELGRTLEGVGILRGAMKRCPNERLDALELAKEEFERGSQLEIGELLYDAYLAEPDFDKACDVVQMLHEPDREKLLSKLRTKVASVRENAPDEDRRLVGLLVAEALVLSALRRSEEVAAALDRALDHDPNLNEIVGRLCKIELRDAPDCNKVRILLARCYLNVEAPDLAAEQLTQAGDDPAFRPRALQMVERAQPTAPILQVRAQLLLLDEQFDAAHEALLAVLEAAPGSEATVRRTLERVPGAPRATDELGLLYARVLAATSAVRRAVEELEQARVNGADAESSLRIADELLERNAHDADLLLLRARTSLDLGRPEEAAPFLRRVLEADPGRAEALRKEIEAAYESSDHDAGLGRLLVELLVDLQAPEDAARVLNGLRDAKSASGQVMYELASALASKYGFSASLLVTFVESALGLGREADVGAAVSYYLESPGTRIPEFTQLVTELVSARPELGESLGRAMQGLPIPSDLRLTLVRCRMAGEDPAAAVREFETLLEEKPELRAPVLAILESFLHEKGDVPLVLELAADLLVDGGRCAEAAEHLARALRAEPAASDRICKRADRLLACDASLAEVWRPLVLTLIDQGRLRHAREMCYRAAQSVPPDRQGFLHVAMGVIQRDSGQIAAAANEFESALACQDAPVERVIGGLRRSIELDSNHGFTRFVLALALLRQGDHGDEVVEQLSEAVRLDQMLVDLALETLCEHAAGLEEHGPARALQGTLFLRKGDRARGVALLDDALTLAPELGGQLLQPLQMEWDRDPDSISAGVALARALRCAGQRRRACRLLSDLSRRFPDEQPRLVTELQRLVEDEPLPEAHRGLWEIALARGERDAALHHVKLACDLVEPGSEAEREVLEAAHRQLPEAAWVHCRLAGLEASSGNDARAESLLRELLERDLGAWERVLETLRSDRCEAPESERLALLEIDTLLAGESWSAAHAALRRFRVAFPDAIEGALGRLRVLVTRGDTGLTADLDLGLLLLEVGKVEEATRTLERALERTREGAGSAGPTDGGDAPARAQTEHRVRLALASLYVDLGREREGKELLASVLDRPGEHGEAYGFLERITKQGLGSKLQNLRETISRSPGNLRARLELARLSLISREFTAAREALNFAGDSPTIEATRRFLLARSYADEDQPHLAAAVVRSIELDDVGDGELRRNVLYLQAGCNEQLGQFGEAHALYLRLVSEFPGFKDTHERARATYQQHLEGCLETRALVLEKRTDLDVT